MSNAPDHTRVSFDPHPVIRCSAEDCCSTSFGLESPASVRLPLMTTSDRTPGWYRFGLFEVDERRGEIRKRGTRIRLRGRPFDILLILLERPGDLISRDELRSRLWTADTFVDFDHGVNTAVNRLREVLGDAADNPRFIETVPRKGYRFIAPVDVLPVREPLPGPATTVPPAPAESTFAPPGQDQPTVSPLPVPAVPIAASGVPTRSLSRPWIGASIAIAIVAITAIAVWLRPAPATPATGPVKMRLAVLPFENLSGDPEQDFFSDGFTEELITELGALQPDRLGVIARTTSMRYKGLNKDVGQIRAELGVDYVLEGSVRRAGDRLRITAQLADAKTQTHLWAENYDRKVSDVIGIQTDVAMAIAKSLAPTLSTRGALDGRPAPSFAAYEYTRYADASSASKRPKPARARQSSISSARLRSTRPTRQHTRGSAMAIGFSARLVGKSRRRTGC